MQVQHLSLPELDNHLSIVQAGVYELIRDDGTPDPTKVLKAKHKYALLTKMQREWEVGRRISSLTDPDQSMPGFMSVGPAVCTAKGNFKGKHSISGCMLALQYSGLLIWPLAESAEKLPF